MIIYILIYLSCVASYSMQRSQTAPESQLDCKFFLLLASSPDVNVNF